MTLQEVTVKNETDGNIWFIIAENARHVVKTERKKVGEIDFETFYKYMVEGKAALPIKGVPIEVSGKESQEFKARLKTYWETHSEDTFEWSGFVEAGELEVAPGRQNRWALKGDELPYYISIRAMQGKVIADAVARRDAVITVDSTGHILDPAPERGEIANKATVYLQKEGGPNFVGDPQTANNGWDSGTCLNAGGSHRFEAASGDLEAGVHVRIISNSATLAAASYKFMYSSDIGWIYYDKQRETGTRDGKKQLWKVLKTSHKDNSPGTKLHYGDRVAISNGNWPKANLGVKGKWLQCVNDDPTIWILRHEARA